MTGHTSMNTVIHAAFRRDLARFDRALSEFPGTQARADQLWAAWENYAHQLHLHHEDEATIFFPAMRQLGADEALVGELDGEHERMAAALDAGTEAMRALHRSPSADNALAAHEAVTAFGVLLTEHLEHEERQLEPWVLEHFRPSPLHRSTRTAVRKAHQGQMGTFLAWLSDGADAGALAGLAREVPAPVLLVLRTFGGRDYRRRVAPTWR